MRDRPQPIPEEATEFTAPKETGRKDKELIQIGLQEFSLKYQPDRSFEENERRLAILSFMEKQGVLTSAQQGLVFDKERMTGSWQREEDYQSNLFTLPEIAEALRGVEGFETGDLNSTDFKKEKIKPRQILAVPESSVDLARGFPRQSQEAVFNLWDLQQRRAWWQKLRLESGEETNVGEAFVAANLFGPMKARRNQSGELETVDLKTGKYKKFSAQGFCDQLRKSPTIILEDGKKVNLDTHPLIYAKAALPHLFEQGLIKESDFRTMAWSETSELFGHHERRLTDKKADVMLPSGEKSAKYYIGRKKIVGTETAIDHETMRVKILDPQTAAIIENRHGKKEILYTFRLLSKDEIEKKRAGLIEKNQNRGRSLARDDISSSTYVDGKEMKKRIGKYDITNYIPKRPDESSEQYAARIASLGDVEFVVDKFKGFFAEAGIGVHNLPWAEQLILANAITEERDRGRLIRFAKQFGVEGLRAFLSCDYDRKMAAGILEIGEKLGVEVASKIFKQYTSVIDLSKKLAESISASGAIKELDVENNHFEEELSEGVVRRAKDCIVAGISFVRKGKAVARVYGKPVSVEDPGEIAEGLAVYAEVLEKIRSLLEGAGEYTASLISSFDQQVPKTYSFKLTGKTDGKISFLTVQLREFGTKTRNSQFEYDGEARINLLFANEGISPFVSDLSRQDALSFRIDREGKTRKNGQITENDPTRRDGEVSLEIGSLVHRDKKLPGSIIGRVVSVGNAIDLEMKEKIAQYYHNRESFSRRFGDSEVFSSIVKLIERKIRENYPIGAPKLKSSEQRAA